ncbi:FkbM family methyltransferase [Nocardiopsis sp. EMB25]|uniref:FkbM family methyltransferase n=1 Tax=Nocardiopsis TaxID=2013 RepID=UPI00034D9473|nr:MULTISPECIES: FkbM family methyltransferase [Nocardiopsis]MCY9787725.1 FkbM family methyltransferase [Nocardiopsis sp. EMB25]
MVTDQLRALVRRYPVVRFATRQIRVRLPRRLGGLDPARVPPWNRDLTVVLPRLDPDPSPAGPDSITLRLPGDLTVPRRLAASGLSRHEPDSLACFLAMLDHTPPGAVLDVGSGVGVYAILAAARTDRPVFAFEPTPEIASAARAVAQTGGLGFVVVELALSNHNGTARLRRARHNDMCNTVVHATRADLAHVPVAVTTLAHWSEEASVLPSVVKVDTVGTEPDVVAGGLEVLRRHRPWMLVKVRPDRGLEERLMALLDPLGYTWYPVGGPPPYEAREEIAGRASPAWERMWMFTPVPAPEEFWRSVGAWRRALDVCVPGARRGARGA